MNGKGGPPNPNVLYRPSLLRNYNRFPRQIQRSETWQSDATSTALAITKYNELVDKLILRAPVPDIDKPPQQSEANPAPAAPARTPNSRVPYVHTNVKTGCNER